MFSKFSLVLDSRGIMGGLGGRLGVLVRILRTTKVVYCVNVSESSGTSLPGLLCIEGY